jgi:hypothetical protein
MKVAASFNNLFPLIFGKASAGGMDDSDCLPGVSTGDKWNNGSTGLHHQIMWKMNDVSYQLDTNIKQVYRNHTEARQLAIDCVTASKCFVIDLLHSFPKNMLPGKREVLIKRKHGGWSAKL